MIYASCTTTYTGFHAVMTEEESKKFEGICFLFLLRLDFIDLVYGLFVIDSKKKKSDFELLCFSTGMPGVIRVFRDYNIDHVTVNKQYGGRNFICLCIYLNSLNG